MEAIQYKCPNCGAGLSFSAEDQKFNCEYCLSSFTQKELDEDLKRSEQELQEKDTEEQVKANEEFADNVSVYSCPNCGAEIVADNTTSATFCYYCHGPVILGGRLKGNFRPSKVIPFKYTREMMLDEYKKWCKKKWFMPNDFSSDAQTEKISGIYLPYWITDCTIHADVTALGKTFRTWRSGNYEYTETKEYNVRRDADINFNKIPADGSSKADDSLMESLEPYDYSGLKDFSMAYLSGYLSEKYDIDKSQVLPRVKQRAVVYSKENIRKSISYTSVNITNQRYDVTKAETDYVLLPVWFMTYIYHGKYYYFAMNGQTGKISGLPPVSAIKLLLTSLGITASCILVGAAGALLSVSAFLGGLIK